MELEINNTPLKLDIYGFSRVAINRDYAGTAFKLMDEMWNVVKSKKLENKGLNIWLYEQDHKIFAGVEFTGIPNEDIGLKLKSVNLLKYAYYKHVGPYNLRKQSGQNMTAELERQGYETVLPYIEIYGHWTNDDTRLETELLMTLK